MSTFRRIFYVWLLLTGSHTLLAQPLEPWIKYKMPPTNGNYEWFTASGKDRTEAFKDFQNNCKCSCINKTEGQSIIFIDQANLSRQQRDELTIKSSTDCQCERVWFIRIREIEVRDEWGTKVYHLYQYSSAGELTAHHLNYQLVDDFDKSKATALSFVPFVGAQSYKGNKGMGRFFLATEAVTLAGAGIAWILSDYYYEDFLGEHNPALRVKYERLSKNTETLSYISLGVAGGLYIGQILHGLFAEGKRKKYELVAVAPYAALKSSGLSLQFNF